MRRSKPYIDDAPEPEVKCSMCEKPATQVVAVGMAGYIDGSTGMQVTCSPVDYEPRCSEHGV